MSVKHTHRAGEIKGMDPAKKLVLMAICDDASQDTRIAYPGIEKLTTWANRSERRITELIEELIRDGLLARRAFSHPGRRAEFIVFPTDAELTELDDTDPRLNSARKRPPRRRRPTSQPVDNSPNMGATDRAHSSKPTPDNARDISPNARDSYRTPPVRTPKNSFSGPVPEVTTDAAPELSTGRTGPVKAAPTPAEVGHGRRGLSPTVGQPLHLDSVRRALPDTHLATTLSDASLAKVANEILGRGRRGGSIADETGYVITALRNPEDAASWITRGFEHEWRAATLPTPEAGF